MNKFKIVVKNNKAGKKYSALVCDLGYTQKFLSFDSYLCAEILGITVRELMETCSEYIISEFKQYVTK